MKISMQFALDRNNNKKIEKEERVDFAALKEKDADSNDILDRRELRDVYFQYGEDTWLTGGRSHRVRTSGQTHIVELQELSLDPASMKMNVNIRL